MEDFNTIKENFNGKITLDNESYFFDVCNNVLKIFFNETGINTVAMFNKTYRKILENGWLHGMCEDGCKITLRISEICKSSFPSFYAEYKLFACVKEDLLFSSDKEKIKNFDSFNEIRISGDLIDKICSRPYFSFDENLNQKLDDQLFLSHESIFIPKKEISLNKKTKCMFEVINSIDIKHNIEHANQISYNSSIKFTFFNEKNIEEFTQLYYSIKNFIDILCFARNTTFDIQLSQNDNDEIIPFASVKVYENYRNYCNRDRNEFVQIQSIQANLSKVFDNLNDPKYTLIFLPIDNDDYHRITYSDIQNLTTAVEIASNLDNKYSRVKKRIDTSDRQAVALAKANIIFNWCNSYKELLKERYQNHRKSWSEPFYYELTIEKIRDFRNLRNDITHRATGIISDDIWNCYHSLRYVLCNYILSIDGNDEDNRHIVK